MRKKLFLCAVLIPLLSGCVGNMGNSLAPSNQSSKQQILNGNELVQLLDRNLVKGKTSKNDILNLLGNPEQRTTNRKDDLWHYNYQNYTGKRPHSLGILIYFDKNGNYYNHSVNQVGDLAKITIRLGGASEPSNYQQNLSNKLEDKATEKTNEVIDRAADTLINRLFSSF